ncbi:MAG: hypothetical protein K5853_07410 [Lachnospiraceae bacterium]|nr:hypothetical protein [Lachnospiraceae bacterium]
MDSLKDLNQQLQNQQLQTLVKEKQEEELKKDQSAFMESFDMQSMEAFEERQTQSVGAISDGMSVEEEKLAFNLKIEEIKENMPEEIPADTKEAIREKTEKKDKLQKMPLECKKALKVINGWKKTKAETSGPVKEAAERIMNASSEEERAEAVSDFLLSCIHYLDANDKLVKMTPTGRRRLRAVRAAISEVSDFASGAGEVYVKSIATKLGTTEEESSVTSSHQKELEEIQNTLNYTREESIAYANERKQSMAFDFEIMDEKQILKEVIVPGDKGLSKVKNIEKMKQKIGDADDAFTLQSYQQMEDLMQGRMIGCDVKTFHSLSAFMEAGEEKIEKNKKLLDLYLGVKKNAQTGMIEGGDRLAALRMMMEDILQIETPAMDDTDYASMEANFEKLERIANKTAAFQRIMEDSKNKDLLELVAKEKISSLQEKMEDLTAVSVSFMLKKDLLYGKKYYDKTMDPKTQTKYLEDAFKRDDHLVGGIRINERNIEKHLKGGSEEQLNLTFPEVFNKEKDTHPEYMRPDMELIEEAVEKMDFDKTLPLCNMITGYSTSGLRLPRLLSMIRRDNTVGMGTQDLIDMIADVFCAAKGSYQKLDKNSDEAKKINERFERGMEKMKTFFLDNMLRYENTFGEILENLSYEDSKQLFKNHGHFYQSHASFLQDVSQLIEGDTEGQYFKPKEKEEDRAYYSIQTHYQLFGRGYTVAHPQEKMEAQGLAVESYETKMDENTIISAYSGDLSYIVDESWRKDFVNYGGFSDAWKDEYRKKQKKKMSAGDYAAYEKRVTLSEGGLQAFVDSWAPQEIKNMIANIKYEVKTTEVGLGILQDKIKSAAYMEQFPEWKNPEIVKDEVLKQKILDMKENVNVLKTSVEILKLRNKQMELKPKYKQQPSEEYLAVKKQAEEMVNNVKVAGWVEDKESLQ